MVTLVNGYMSVTMDGLQVFSGHVSVPPVAYLYVTSSTGGSYEGTIAGEGDHQTAFAGRIGGGLDFPLSKHFMLRAAQVDYYATTFANTSNDHQNDLLVGAGILYRWSR